MVEIDAITSRINDLDQQLHSIEQLKWDAPNSEILNSLDRPLSDNEVIQHREYFHQLSVFATQLAQSMQSEFIPNIDSLKKRKAQFEQVLQHNEELEHQVQEQEKTIEMLSMQRDQQEEYERAQSMNIVTDMERNLLDSLPQMQQHVAYLEQETERQSQLMGDSDRRILQLEESVRDKDARLRNRDNLINEQRMEMEQVLKPELDRLKRDHAIKLVQLTELTKLHQKSANDLQSKEEEFINLSKVHMQLKKDYKVEKKGLEAKLQTNTQLMVDNKLKLQGQRIKIKDFEKKQDLLETEVKDKTKMIDEFIAVQKELAKASAEEKAKALSSQDELKKFLSNVQENPQPSLGNISGLGDQSGLVNANNIYAQVEKDGHTVTIYIDDKPFKVSLMQNDLDNLSMMSGYGPEQRHASFMSGQGGRSFKADASLTNTPASQLNPLNMLTPLKTTKQQSNSRSPNNNLQILDVSPTEKFSFRQNFIEKQDSNHLNLNKNQLNTNNAMDDSRMSNNLGYNDQTNQDSGILVTGDKYQIDVSQQDALQIDQSMNVIGNQNDLSYNPGNNVTNNNQSDYIDNNNNEFISPAQVAGHEAGEDANDLKPSLFFLGDEEDSFQNNGDQAQKDAKVSPMFLQKHAIRFNNSPLAEQQAVDHFQQDKSMPQQHFLQEQDQAYDAEIMQPGSLRNTIGDGLPLLEESPRHGSSVARNFNIDIEQISVRSDQPPSVKSKRSTGLFIEEMQPDQLQLDDCQFAGQDASMHNTSHQQIEEQIKQLSSNSNTATPGQQPGDKDKSLGQKILDKQQASSNKKSPVLFFGQAGGNNDQKQFKFDEVSFESGKNDDEDMVDEGGLPIFFQSEIDFNPPLQPSNSVPGGGFTGISITKAFNPSRMRQTESIMTQTHVSVQKGYMLKVDSHGNTLNRIIDMDELQMADKELVINTDSKTRTITFAALTDNPTINVDDMYDQKHGSLAFTEFSNRNSTRNSTMKRTSIDISGQKIPYTPDASKADQGDVCQCNIF